MSDVILVAIIIAALVYTLGDAGQTRDPYCEMVSIYQQSGGQYGWPDYRDNYNEVCKREN